MNINEQLWTNYEKRWNSMKIFEKRRILLKSMKIIKNNENQWTTIRNIENQWKALKFIEHRWKSMKFNENYCEHMKIIENK